MLIFSATKSAPYLEETCSKTILRLGNFFLILIKISSIKLPEGVIPTIIDRDFVIATVSAPTVLVEPEKVEETAVEGEVPIEGAEGAEGTPTTEEGKPSDDKIKTTAGNKGEAKKPSDDKAKGASGDKGKSANKEAKKK